MLIDTIWNLGNNNLVVAFVTFDFSLCTHNNTSTTSLVSILYSLKTIDISTCREVWSRDILHQLLSSQLRIVDISAATINYFSKVVGRNISCHTYSNTITTIYKEVRNLCRHNSWLNQRVVEVVCHVDSLFVEIVHHLFTHS